MIKNNASTVIDGLIFSFDANNIKSYVGPAMSNIATEIAPRGISDNGSSFRFFSGTDTDYIPSIGNVTYNYVDMYNDYGSSGNCCPSPFSYGQGLSVSPSTLYTYGVVYRSANRYTNPNLMYHYEYNGGTYLTEFGVHNAGYSWQETHLGNGWYWSRAKFTTQSTANTFYTGAWMYQYSTWNRWEIAKVLISPGDWTNLHPVYWPSFNTTRSSTGVVSDLTGNNTLTVNNLTYNNDGTFSFNGSSSVITAPNNTIFDTQTPTVEVWIKTNATSQNGFWFEKGSVNTEYSLFQEGGSIVWRQGGNSQYTTTANYIGTSNWAQIVGTYTPGDRRTYINGVLVTSDTLNASVGVNGNGITIGSYNSGGYFYNGSIGIVRVYNKALTANEVKQNFNAQRGRYGL